MKYILIFLIAINAYGLDLKTSNNFKEAMNEAKQSNKRVLLFLKSGFCPWCHKMEEEILESSEVTKFINNNYIFLKLDKDKDDYPKKFFSDIVPTTYLIDPIYQEKVHTMYGYVKADIFVDELDFYNDH
jgi:thioredoxin-related protein